MTGRDCSLTLMIALYIVVTALVFGWMATHADATFGPSMTMEQVVVSRSRFMIVP